MARLSGADRRRQIIETACDVIIEKGLAQAATRDVTRALDVGSGLLHHYFASWQDLRAEAVRTFVHKEIEEIEALLHATPPDQMAERFIDWMAEDEDLRHWTLWLNAINEARLDPVMAAVIREAYAKWQKVIADLLDHIVAGQIGRCADTGAAACRLSALIDGLAGLVLVGDGQVTLEIAKQMLRTQFDHELSLEA